MKAESFVNQPSRMAIDAPDGVVCFAGVDWWYHNRGHSECQIMHRIAGELPVLWVNSIGMRMPTRKKSELVLSRYWRKLKSTLKGLQRDPSGMWVYSPIFLPRYTPAVLRFNGWLLNLQVRWLLRRLGVKNPSAFITVPTAAPALDHGKYHTIVFNRSDKFSEFPEVDAELIVGLEQRLFKKADEVLYVSQKLLEEERAVVPAAHFLDQGVDYKHFASSRNKYPGSADKRLVRLQESKQQIIGFYGALDSYTIDLDLMIRVAKSFPDALLLVIGPKAMEIGDLVAESNVVYLDAIPYEELPPYAACFDVAIMPWLQNEWIKYCNPIKLKEYLALGCPIVSIQFPQLMEYRDVVLVADTPDRFIELLKEALEGTEATLAAAETEARRKRVRQDSWDAQARDVAGYLKLS